MSLCEYTRVSAGALGSQGSSEMELQVALSNLMLSWNLNSGPPEEQASLQTPFLCLPGAIL